MACSWNDTPVLTPKEQDLVITSAIGFRYSQIILSPTRKQSVKQLVHCNYPSFATTVLKSNTTSSKVILELSQKVGSEKKAIHCGPIFAGSNWSCKEVQLGGCVVGVEEADVNTIPGQLRLAGGTACAGINTWSTARICYEGGGDVVVALPTGILNCPSS